MKKVLLVLLLCPFFSISCYAEGLYASDVLENVYTVEEALPEAQRNINGELKLDGSYDAAGALERLWRRFLDQIVQQGRNELSTIVSLLGLSLLCAVASAFCTTAAIRETVDRIGCCAAALLLTNNVYALFSQASDTVLQLSDYSHAALPIVFTMSAASGAVISSSARYAAACLAMDVMITAAQRLILPLIYAYLALAVSQSLFENSVITMLLNVSKWAITTLLTTLTLAFSAYLSLTGLISQSADALAVKSTRTVLSRALPVVGGILADSASVFLSAASIIRNSAGVFALIAVCALCVVPIALLLVKALAFKLTAVIADFQPGSHVAKLISSMGNVFAMLLGLVGSCGAMLFISLVSGIKAVSSG